MKLVLALLVTVSLLLAWTALASAEILFGVSAETGASNFSAAYSSNLTPDVSKSPLVYRLDGNLNLLGTVIRLEYGAADMNPYSCAATNLTIGWDFGPSILQTEVFGGYQQFTFTDNTVSGAAKNTYSGLMGGVSLKSRIARITLYGTAVIPLKTYYTNSVTEDNNAAMNHFTLGVAYAPFPLVDLFLNYRALNANSSVVNVATQSYTIGAKFSF